jgi:hypothetical protein
MPRAPWKRASSSGPVPRPEALYPAERAASRAAGGADPRADHDTTHSWTPA